MVWNLAAAALAYLVVPLLLPLYKKQASRNYRRESVPAGLGYSFLLPAVLVMILRSGRAVQPLLCAILLLLFAALGAVDDALGSPDQKGFRGHLRGGVLSSGALKALGGAVSALVAASLLESGWLELLVNGGLMALGANFLNLLDLRPGRAAKAFLLLSLPFHFFTPRPVPLQVLCGAVLGYLPWDLSRKAMMGDTGANPLGAALGLMAAWYLPLAVKAVLLAALAALNLLSERISFSRVIEGSRFLDFLDRLGR